MRRFERFDSAERGGRARSASRLEPLGRRASSPIDGFAQADTAGFDRGTFASCAGVRSLVLLRPPFLHRQVLHMFRAEVTHGA